MEKKISIGQAIRTIRKRKGISAIFLANKVGIDPSTLSKYESNQRRVNVELLPIFASALDVSVQNFFEEQIGETSTINKTA